MFYIFAILLLLKFTEAIGVVGVDVSISLGTLDLSETAQILDSATSDITDRRWSSYKQPVTNTVIRVGTKEDVIAIVTACYTNRTVGCSVLAQSGGHGWSSSINISTLGIIIDMTQLNSFVPSSDKTNATIGGGIITGDLIMAASNNSMMVTTGNCNTVGYLGQALGGGYGNMATSRNLGHFQFLSMDIVLANGTFLQGVTAASHPDLWFAMRGAGPNFGIVTSAVVKAYPITGNSNMAYLAQWFYNESQLEQVITAMNKTSINQPGAAYLFFTRPYAALSPEAQFFVSIYYYGNQAGALSTFKYLYDVGPVKIANNMSVDYRYWNSFSDLVGAKGGQKPTWGANMRYLNPTDWRTIWNGFKDLVTNPYYNNASGVNDFSSSYVLLEQYYIPGLWGPSTPQYSFPVSQTRFISAITPWYYTTNFAPNATDFGNNARVLLRKSSGISPYIQYINYAFGDESLDMIYGSSLAQLKKLKLAWDPYNFLHSWFDIPPDNTTQSS